MGTAPVRPKPRPLADIRCRFKAGADRIPHRTGDDPHAASGVADRANVTKTLASVASLRCPAITSATPNGPVSVPE